MVYWVVDVLTWVSKISDILIIMYKNKHIGMYTQWQWTQFSSAFYRILNKMMVLHRDLTLCQKVIEQMTEK